jgi:hypothetical protein
MTHITKTQAEPASASERRQKTALFHRILLTFHDAADTRDIEVALRLLKILESLATAPTDATPQERTRALRGLVAAHERLWAIRFGETSGAPRSRR